MCDCIKNLNGQLKEKGIGVRKWRVPLAFSLSFVAFLPPIPDGLHDVGIALVNAALITTALWIFQAD